MPARLENVSFSLREFCRGRKTCYTPDRRAVVVDRDLALFAISIQVLVIGRRFIEVSNLVLQRLLTRLPAGELVQHLKNVNIAVTASVEHIRRFLSCVKRAWLQILRPEWRARTQLPACDSICLGGMFRQIDSPTVRPTARPTDRPG